MRKVRMLAAGALMTGVAFAGSTGTAWAAPVFAGGLVNVNIEDVNVQIPIGVAANVCGVTVAVLAELPPGTAFDCDAAVMQDLPVAVQ